MNFADITINKTTKIFMDIISIVDVESIFRLECFFSAINFDIVIGRARVAMVISKEYVGITREYRDITSVPTILV